MSENNDRQDKGADHYSDMIRNPSRSVKVYNQLMWNERRQKLDLDGIERSRQRNLNESRKSEKAYLEKLAELKDIKKFITKNKIQNKTDNVKSSLLSVAVRNKRTLSTNAQDYLDFQETRKPVTIYEMHLVDSKKLFSKAKEFIKHLNFPLNGDNDVFEDDEKQNNEFTGNQITGIKSFDSFNTKADSKGKNSAKLNNPRNSLNSIDTSKTPSTTPIFGTEIADESKRKSRVIQANKKFSQVNFDIKNGRLQPKATPIVKKVQIQQVKKGMISEDPF
jgi:hypothetical protein